WSSDVCSSDLEARRTHGFDGQDVVVVAAQEVGQYGGQPTPGFLKALRPERRVVCPVASAEYQGRHLADGSQPGTSQDHRVDVQLQEVPSLHLLPEPEPEHRRGIAIEHHGCGGAMELHRDDLARRQRHLHGHGWMWRRHGELRRRAPQYIEAWRAHTTTKRDLAHGATSRQPQLEGMAPPA